MKQDCAVIVFAKAPAPGYAKTRLARAIGNEAAANLALRMLHATLTHAVEADIGPVELCCTPDDTHPAFREAADMFPLTLSLQGDGDLGERMHRALSRHLANHPRALLIGTDAPALDAPQLRRAAAALQTSPAVFGPTADGGYVLVGLTRPMPSLFADMQWSTGSVMTKTRERLKAACVEAAELPVMRDIDEPEDLVYLPQEWRAALRPETGMPGLASEQEAQRRHRGA